jgi:phage shock protein E
LLALLAGCGGATTESSAALGAPAAQVSGREARHLVEEGAVLLDVRSSVEYAMNHLDGAVNIPVDELGARTRELDPDAEIVVYCLSGHRSEQAGRILTGAGLRHVHDLGSIANY